MVIHPRLKPLLTPLLKPKAWITLASMAFITVALLHQGEKLGQLRLDASGWWLLVLGLGFTWFSILINGLAWSLVLDWMGHPPQGVALVVGAAKTDARPAAAVSVDVEQHAGRAVVVPGAARDQVPPAPGGLQWLPVGAVGQRLVRGAQVTVGGHLVGGCRRVASEQQVLAPPGTRRQASDLGAHGLGPTQADAPPAQTLAHQVPRLAGCLAPDVGGLGNVAHRQFGVGPGAHLLGRVHCQAPHKGRHGVVQLAAGAVQGAGQAANQDALRRRWWRRRQGSGWW